MVRATNGLPMNSKKLRAGPSCERHAGDGGHEDEDEWCSDDGEDGAERYWLRWKQVGARRTVATGGTFTARSGSRGTGAVRCVNLDLGLHGDGLAGNRNHLLGDRNVDLLADPLAEEVAADDPGGDAAGEAHDDDPAEVDVEQSRRGDRSRVRGQEGVHHRQAGEERQAVEEDRPLALDRCDVDQRCQNEDAYIEEDRDAENQPRQPHRERGAVLAEAADETIGKDLGAPGCLEHRAQHRPQANDDGDAAEDAPDAFLDQPHGLAALRGADNLGGRDPSDKGDREASHRAGRRTAPA